MIKILFICHGNICRSPMAEFLCRDMAGKKGLSGSFQIASAATSSEEIGNPVHRGTRCKLAQYGISTAGKQAVLLRRADYEAYDYLIGMDDWNIRDMKRIFGGDPQGKIYKILHFAGLERDVADPWYTGNFDSTYDDIKLGLEGFFQFLEESRENCRLK